MCVSQPASLIAFRDAGLLAFGPIVLQHRFGESDVVEYLKQKNNHAAMLKKLEKLQKSIEAEHSRLCSESARAAINQQRSERFAAIEAASLNRSIACPTPLALLDHSTGDEARGEAAQTAHTSSPSTEEGEDASLEARLQRTVQIPPGSLRRRCGVCKCAYSQVHNFYHQLCPEW